MCSKVLNGHIILTDTSITTILAPEMTYTPFLFGFGVFNGISRNTEFSVKRVGLCRSRILGFCQPRTLEFCRSRILEFCRPRGWGFAGHEFWSFVGQEVWNSIGLGSWALLAMKSGTLSAMNNPLRRADALHSFEQYRHTCEPIPRRSRMLPQNADRTVPFSDASTIAATTPASIIVEIAAMQDVHMNVIVAALRFGPLDDAFREGRQCLERL